jgi:glycosyltransferase involved in cell wall biosynthesis
VKNLAFIHDWIIGLRGGERCLLAFLLLYLDSQESGQKGFKADVFSLFYKKNSSHKIIDDNFKEASVLNKLPNATSWYKALLPFYPLVRWLKLEKYNYIISLSHAAAKNIKKSKNCKAHISYCFTPMRYIWDQVATYLGWKRFFVWPLVLLLRAWDRSCSKEVDHFVAISNFVSARIRKFYGRESHVIYPPVASEWINHANSSRPESVPEGEKAFLFASALVPYKGAELAVAACSNLGLKLWVAGSGPLESKLRSTADKNINFIGKVTDQELSYLLLNCRALIFPCKEDFGILPIEAQFAGKAVIALQAGACKETILGLKSDSVIDKDFAYSGVFIKNSKDPKQLLINTEQAIKQFLAVEQSFDPDFCKKAALRYSAGAFYDSWQQFLQDQNLDLLSPVTKDSFVRQFEALRSNEK